MLFRDPSVEIWYEASQFLRNGFGSLIINCDKYPLSVTAFRRAFAFALDKERISSEVFQGTSVPLDSLVPQVNPFCIEGTFVYSYYQSDLDTAKYLLDAAGFLDVDTDGWREAPDGFEFSVNIEVADTSVVATQIGYIAEENLRSIGIDATCVPIVYYDYAERMHQNGDFDVVFLGFNLLDYELDYLADEYWSENADIPYSNRPNFRNSTFDSWRSQLLEANDFDGVFEAAAEMQKILTFECPEIVCYENYMASATRVGLEDVYANHIQGATTFDSFNNMVTRYGYLREIEAAVAGPRTMNPFRSAWWDFNYMFDPMSLIYEGLAREDYSGNLVPSIAESWSVTSSVDGVDIYVELRNDVLFHDLTPLDVDDVIFTFNYVLLHDQSYYDLLTMVNSIEIVDDDSLVIHASSISYWDVRDILTMSILPEHIWSQISDADDFVNSDPIGTGPFIYVSHEAGVLPADGYMDYMDEQLSTVDWPETGSLWTGEFGDYVFGVNLFEGELPLEYNITFYYESTEFTVFGTITEEDVVYWYDWPSNADDVEDKQYVSLPSNTEVYVVVDWNVTADLDIFVWPAELEYYDGPTTMRMQRWHDYYQSPHELLSLESSIDGPAQWTESLTFDLDWQFHGPYDITENQIFWRYSPEGEAWTNWELLEEMYDLTTEASGVSSFAAVFGEGYYQFQMNTTDWVGHVSTVETSVGVDHTDPVANAGADLVLQQYHDFFFDGTASYDTVGIVAYHWTFVDGVPVTLFGATPEYAFQNEGEFEVVLTVMDNYGHSASDTLLVTVIYDEEPPVVAISGPASDSVVWLRSIYVIESSDVGGVALTEVYLDSLLELAEPSAYVEYLFDPFAMDDGMHYITFRVVDIFDQETVIEYLIYTDTTPPSIDSPDDLSYTGGDTGYSITWTPSDAYPDSYEVYTNGTLFESGDWSGSSITVVVDGMNVGAWNFTIIVDDDYTHSTIDLVWVTVLGNTPYGEDIVVEDSDTGIIFEFEETTSAGWTNVTESEMGPHPPDGFRVMGVYYDITTTVNFEGLITVAFPYDEAYVRGREENLRIWHWREIGGWEDVTSWVDTVENIIYGVVTDLSPFALMEDAAPPATSIELSGLLGEEGWYLSEVTVTLDAIDAISDIAEIAYSFDEINWVTYTGPFTISDEGLTTIYYNSTDIARNMETPNREDIWIDTKDPETVATLDPSSPTGSNGWYFSSVTMSLSPSDATSGVSQTFHRVNSGTAESYDSPVLFSTDGLYEVEYWSVDSAGNPEQVNTISFRIDQSEPITTLMIQEPSYGLDPTYVKTTTDFILDADDETSKVAWIEYRIDGTGWMTYSDPFRVTTFGPHDVDYRSVDYAGNVEEYQTVSIVVNAASLTYLYATTGEYSDEVILRTSMIDMATEQPIDGKTILFTIGDQSVTGTTENGGVASAAIILDQPAGLYTVTASFVKDADYMAASVSTGFIIEREHVTAEYTGSTVVPTTVETFTLRATVFEVDDGYWGDLSYVYVTFEIYSVPIDTANPVAVIGPIKVDTTDMDGVGVATAEAENLPENGYVVLTKFETGANNYYSGPPSDLVTIIIYEPTGDFVTGGGWIWDPSGSKGNFGFNVKYKKNGLPRGQAIYIFRVGDWEYIVKSNAWLGMAIDGNHSCFEAKCTVQQFNSRTGELVWDEGNYQLRIDVWDGEEDGEPDEFQIRVYDKNGVVWHEAGFDPRGYLQGGNIVIHRDKEK
jgi:ABC-type transport system substrate-binding protein